MDAFADSPVVAYLQIEIRQNGALSVAGSIDNEAYAITALQSAIDAVRSHHSREKVLVIPNSATGLSRD